MLARVCCCAPSAPQPGAVPNSTRTAVTVNVLIFPNSIVFLRRLTDARLLVRIHRTPERAYR